jgi:hypothetical protein
MKRFLIAAFMALAVLLIGGALTGCEAQRYGGTASYSLKPMKLEGVTVCCELTVNNGKEIESIKVHIEKKGEHFTFDLEEKGIKAFKGQSISSDSIPGISTLPIVLP